MPRPSMQWKLREVMGSRRHSQPGGPLDVASNPLSWANEFEYDSDDEAFAESVIKKLERFHLPEYADGLTRIMLPSGDCIDEKDNKKRKVGRLLDQCGRFNAAGVGPCARIVGKCSRSRIRGPFATREFPNWNTATVNTRRELVMRQTIYRRKDSSVVLQPGIYIYEPNNGLCMQWAVWFALLCYPPYALRQVRLFIKSVLFGDRRFVVMIFISIALMCCVIATLYELKQQLETWFHILSWAMAVLWLGVGPSMLCLGCWRACQVRWKLRKVRRPGKALQLQQQITDEIVLGDRSLGIPDDYGVVCLFKGVSFPNVKVAKGKTDTFSQRRLRNVDGAIIPGRLTAIMGASGSGKSTLLRSLADRFPSGNEGNLERIRWNGNVTNTYYSSLIRMVYQMDMIYPELTVGEVLMLSAKLQLPGASWKEITSRVAHVLKVCALTEKVDNRVGDDILPGISGGQRRRLSIAIELLAEPQTLFLDEPTSGLDAATALELIENLYFIARSTGIAVVMVIHQPRVEIFDYLDYLMVVNHGELLFYLSIKSAVALIEKSFPAAKGENIGDIILDVLEGKQRRVPGEGEVASDLEADLIHFKRELSTTNAAIRKKVLRLDKMAAKSTTRMKIKKQNICRRCCCNPVISICMLPRLASVLLGRVLLIEMRRKKSHIVELGRTLGLSLLVGFTLFQIGLGADDTKHRLNTFYFTVTYVVMNQAIGTPPFFQHFKYFKREYDYGTVSPTMFTMLLTAWEASKEIFHTSIFTTILFVLMGLGGFVEWLYWVVILTISANVSTSLMYFIAAYTDGHEKDTVVLWIVLLTLMAYYAGFMIEKGDIPWYCQPIYWVSIYKWSFDGVMHALFPPLELDFVFGNASCDEVSSTNSQCFSSGCASVAEICPISGRAVLNEIDMAEANKYMSIFVLVLCVIVFRLCGYLLLRMRLFRPLVYPTQQKDVTDEYADVTEVRSVDIKPVAKRILNTVRIMNYSKAEETLISVSGVTKAPSSAAIVPEENTATGGRRNTVLAVRRMSTVPPVSLSDQVSSFRVGPKPENDMTVINLDDVKEVDEDGLDHEDSPASTDGSDGAHSEDTRSEGGGDAQSNDDGDGQAPEVDATQDENGAVSNARDATTAPPEASGNTIVDTNIDAGGHESKEGEADGAGADEAELRDDDDDDDDDEASDKQQEGGSNAAMGNAWKNLGDVMMPEEGGEGGGRSPHVSGLEGEINPPLRKRRLRQPEGGGGGVELVSGPDSDVGAGLPSDAGSLPPIPPSEIRVPYSVTMNRSGPAGDVYEAQEGDGAGSAKPDGATPFVTAPPGAVSKPTELMSKFKVPAPNALPPVPTKPFNQAKKKKKKQKPAPWPLTRPKPPTGPPPPRSPPSSPPLAAAKAENAKKQVRIDDSSDGPQGLGSSRRVGFRDIAKKVMISQYMGTGRPSSGDEADEEPPRPAVPSALPRLGSTHQMKEVVKLNLAEVQLNKAAEKLDEDEVLNTARTNALRRDHPDYDNWQKLKNAVAEFDRWMQHAHVGRKTGGQLLQYEGMVFRKFFGKDMFDGGSSSSEDEDEDEDDNSGED